MEIAAAKTNSLDLLTLPEILDRDYKEWTESTRSDEKAVIGVSSVVKPLDWLLDKAGSAEELLVQIQTFMNRRLEPNPEAGRSLSLFAIMTTSTDPDGKFQRELLLLPANPTASKALEAFESQAPLEFKLEPWTGKSDLVNQVAAKKTTPPSHGPGRIWRQRDVSKSRKQVAPLLRTCMQQALKSDLCHPG